MNRQQTQMIIRAAHDLELPWLAFTDNDDAGQLALGNATHPQTDQPLTADSDEVVMSGQKQIEQLLIDAGYSDEIEQVAHDNDLQMGTGKNRHLLFLKSNKPWAAEQVAIRAMDANKRLPDSVVALARKLDARLGTTNEAA